MFAGSLGDVPSGVVGLKSPQALAFARAAVRMERKEDQRRDAVLVEREYFSVVLGVFCWVGVGFAVFFVLVFHVCVVF